MEVFLIPRASVLALGGKDACLEQRLWGRRMMAETPRVQLRRRHGPVVGPARLHVRDGKWPGSVHQNSREKAAEGTGDTVVGVLGRSGVNQPR